MIKVKLLFMALFMFVSAQAHATTSSETAWVESITGRLTCDASLTCQSDKGVTVQFETVKNKPGIEISRKITFTKLYSKVTSDSLHRFLMVDAEAHAKSLSKTHGQESVTIQDEVKYKFYYGVEFTRTIGYSQYDGYAGVGVYFEMRQSGNDLVLTITHYFV